MQKLFLTLAISLLSVNFTFAQAPVAADKKAAPAEAKAAPAAEKPATTQQSKMKTCNATAKEKKLAGDERKKFMKECLSNK